MTNARLVEKMMNDTNNMIQLLEEIKLFVNKYGDPEVIKANGGMVKIVTDFLSQTL